MPDPGAAARGRRSAGGPGSGQGYYATGATNVTTYESKSKFLALQSEAPELDASTQWNLATSGMPTADMLSAARSAIGIGGAQQAASRLKTLPDAQQRALWAQTSSERQKLLIEQGGYTPPDVAGQRSEKWWQTGLLAAPRAVGWAYDKSSLDRVVDRVGIDDIANFTMDKLTNLGDDFAGRPWRTMRDMSGQERAARMDMTLAQAQQDLEAQGYSLNSEQWQYLKWQYLNRNPLDVLNVGSADNDPGTGNMLRTMVAATPGIGALGNVAADAMAATPLKDAPIIGGILDRFANQGTRHNPYESKTGQTAPDSVYQAFEDKVNLLQKRPDYSMSPWASWNRVDNGRTYIAPTVKRRAMEMMGGKDSEALDYATWKSQGRSLDEFVAESLNLDPTDPRFDTEAARIARTYEADPIFAEAVKYMSRDQAKISFGRDYARTLGIPDDSGLFTAVSGAADAVHISVMDPMLVLGKATKVARVARLGTSVAEIDNIARAARSIEAGEGVWKVAQTSDEVAQLAEATGNLRSITAPVMDMVSFDKIDDLVDEAGHATPFLTENFNEVKRLVDWAAERADAGRAGFREHADAIDVLQSTMADAMPVLDNPQMGGVFGAVRKFQAQRTKRWADRVAEAYDEFTRTGAEESLDQLVRDVPHILPGLEGLTQYHLASVAAGGPGLSTTDGVFDALKAMSGEVGLGAGQLNGSAVRGFGNGVNVPERWRLWADASEDVPRINRAREELLQLPELSRGSQAWRRVMNGAEDTMVRWKEGRGITGAIPGVRRFQTAAGSLAFQLTHQAPRAAALPLVSDQALVEARKLRDFGLTMGMTKAEGDAFFAKFIGGLQFDNSLRYLGDEAAIADASDLLATFSKQVADRRAALGQIDNLVAEGAMDAERAAAMRTTIEEGFTDDLARQFSARFDGEDLADLVDAKGHATPWFTDNYESVMKWRDEVLDSQPHLANHAVVQSLGRVARAGRISTTATRVALVKGYLEHAMVRAGVKATPEGAAWADNFLGKLQTGAYTGSDLDIMHLGSEATRQGVLPLAHFSDWMAIPDVAELQRAATNLSLTQRVFKKVNGPMVDAIMSKGWKPATLMRLGFIPRAVGEEALAFVAGRGIFSLEGYIGSWATKDTNVWPIQLARKVLRSPARKWGELYGIDNADELWNFVNVIPYHSVREYMSEMSIAHLGRTADELKTLDRFTLAADYMAAKATARMKRVEFQLLPEQMKRAALVQLGTQGEEGLAKAAAMNLPDLYERFTRGVADDARQLLRNGEMISRAYAQEMSGLGARTWYTPEEGWGAHETMSVRMNPYQSEDVATLEMRVGRDWVKLDTPAKLDDATAIQLAYALNQRAIDPVAMAGIEAGLGGRVSLEALLDNIGPALGEPAFAPNVGEMAAEAGARARATGTVASAKYETLLEAELADRWRLEPFDEDLVDEITRRLDDGRIDARNFVPDDAYHSMPDLPPPPGAEGVITADTVLRDALDTAREDALRMKGQATLYDPYNPRHRPGINDFDEFDPVDRQLEHLKMKQSWAAAPVAPAESPELAALDDAVSAGTLTREEYAHQRAAALQAADPEGMPVEILQTQAGRRYDQLQRIADAPEGAPAQFHSLTPDQRGGDIDALLADVRERGHDISDDPDFLYRGVNFDDQWYVDAEGNLHFRANVSGRNAGETISTTAAPEFSIDWVHSPIDFEAASATADSPIVFRVDADTVHREGMVRGEGFDPGERELISENGETIVPAGKWTAYGMDDGAEIAPIPDASITAPDGTELNTGSTVTHRPQLTRNAIIDELEAIARGELRPQESKYWRDQADRGVSDLVRDVQDRGSVVIDPPSADPMWGYRGTATREDAERILAKAEALRVRVRAWDEEDLNLLHRHFQGEHGYGPGNAGLYSKELNRYADLLDTLPPGLRNLVDHADPRAPINDLLAHAIKKSAAGEPQMLEDLAILAGNKLGTGSRWAQALSGKMPLRIADKAVDIEEMRNAIYAALQSAENAPYVRANVRSVFTRDGTPTRMRPYGQKRVYSAMGDKELASAITRMRMDGREREIINGLRAVGMTPEQERIITTMLREWDTPGVEAQINAALEAKQGTLVPLGRVQFESYDQADEITQLFDRWKPGAGDYARQNLTTDYADVGKITATGYADLAPDARLGDPMWRENNPGLVQLNDRPLYQMRPYSDLPQMRYDDYGIPDPTGAHVAEGLDDTDALKDWADLLAEDLAHTYLTPHGDVLHELVGPSLDGKFGVANVRSVAPTDLPTNLYAPQKYAVPTNWWSRAVNYGFSQVINPAIFAGVRHPRFSLEFSDALAGVREATRSLRNGALDAEVNDILHGLGTTMEEARSAWYAIHEDARRLIDSGPAFREAMGEAVNAERLHDGNLLFGLDDDTLHTVAKWARQDAHVEAVATRSALGRAMDALIPYLDDHEVRSFFQVTARNLMPFQFAQEQFYKRWINTIRYSPEALRRAQLIAHGFTSSGFVKEDEYGNRAFVIPASEAFGNVLAKTPYVSAVFGKAAAVPISVPLTGDVKTVLPGIPGDLEQLPSLSPIAMVPARMVTNLFPETRPVLQLVNGGQPVNDLQATPASLVNGIVEQFVPRNYQRAFGALVGGGTDFIEGELNKATIGAMQMMEAEAIRLRAEAQQLADAGDMERSRDLFDRAEDLSPGDGATPEQMDAYLDKVRDWSRANMLTRAVVGFVGPNAARNDFEGMEFRKEFTDLLDHMDFDEALGVFLAEHPDGRPWTVFDTTKATKADVPPTEKSLQWLDDNADYLAAFPQAGPWLMPQSTSTDEFSQQAYAQEVAVGLRSRKTPKEWYEAYKWASAANVYFPAKNRVDAALLTADADTRKVISSQWEAWSAAFKNQHPIFASQLNGSKGADTKSTLEELSLALSDPNSPPVEHKREMAQLVNAYFRYDRERTLRSGDNSTAGRAYKKQLDAEFLDWGWGFVAQFPTVRSLWTSLVVPAADLRSLDQARQLTTTGGR